MTERELYEDWKPLLEAQQDALAVDTAQILEDGYVEQTNGPRGTSAGGPRDPGYQEPLSEKPPHTDC